MENTPHLNLPYIAAAQAQKHVTHNEAIRSLDAIVHLSVLDRDLTSPPASLSDGDRYIVASSASGDWVGKDGYIAAWQDGAWMFHLPQEGWLCWISDEGLALAWNGTSWQGITTSSGTNPTSLVGVNATADTTNKLSVSSPAALFSHEGSDHRIILNKNSETDTGSLLYQNNFSGRAELGLTGSDDFSVKVSADGNSWINAIEIDQATGIVSLPQTPTIGSGSATGKNLLINGDMSINQRTFGGGALGAGVYGFDRWKADSGGCTISVTGDVISLTNGTIVQIVEAPALAGKTITLSVEDLTGGDLDIEIEGVTNTIFSGSGRQGVTIDIPVLSTGNITAKLTPDSVAVTFSRVKLETGDAATDWAQPDITQELLRCKRYFTDLGDSIIYGMNYAGVHSMIRIFFMVPMYSNPTLGGSINHTGTHQSTYISKESVGYYIVNDNSVSLTNFTAEAEL